MYLRRKIDSFLEDWGKNGEKLPLIVKGARQIGKTESILHFAQIHYKYVVYINFVTDVKYKKITVDGYEPENIIKNISHENRKANRENRSLVVFQTTKAHSTPAL